MGSLFNFTAGLFYQLLFMSLVASAIGALILLFRKVTGSRVAPGWQYAVWIILLLSLLIPINLRLDSVTSVTGVAAPISEISFREEFETAQTQYRELIEARYDLFRETRTYTEFNSLQTRHTFFDIVIPAVWLAGVFVFVLILIFGRIRLDKKIKSNEIQTDSERIKILFDICKAQLSVKTDFKIVIQNYIMSPALLGIVKPKIILPTYVADMEDERVKHIIFHEIAHYKRFDIFVNYLLLALQAVYWFNPFIWFAFNGIRQDMEQVNDAYVLKRIGKDNTVDYGMTLIETLGKTNEIPYLPKAFSMANSKSNMVQRIKKIKLNELFDRHRIFAGVLSGVMIVLLCMLFMTNHSAEGANFGAPGQRESGNWYRITPDGQTGMLTLYDDLTISLFPVSVVEANQIMTGEFAMPPSDDEEREFGVVWYELGGSDLLFAVYIEFFIFSLSPDGKTMELISDTGEIWTMTKATKPSMLQLSLSSWEGILPDGSIVIIDYSLDKTVTISIDSNGSTSYFAGNYIFSNGWLHKELSQDMDSWQQYREYRHLLSAWNRFKSVMSDFEAQELFIERSEINREYMDMFAGTEDLDEAPLTPFNMDFNIAFRQYIDISTDGNTLLLYNFFGNEGQLLELTRR